MQLERSIKLEVSSGVAGITVNGSCRIGHKRRCPKVYVEPAVCLGEESETEAVQIGMGTFIGRGTRIRRLQSIGRFTTIGEDCRIGVSAAQKHQAYRRRTEEGLVQDIRLISNSWTVRDNNLGWQKNIMRIDHPYPNRRLPPSDIGNDVWIGDGVLIEEGVKIGNGAVIAPGTVVVSDVPAFAVVSGNPGVVSKYRFPAAEISALAKLEWWDYGVQLIRDEKLPVMPSKTLIAQMLRKAEQLEKIPFCQTGFLFQSHAGKNSVYTVQTTGEKEACTLLYCLPDM